MSQSYVVRNEIGQVLELRPFDGRWVWTNALQHGTPLSAEDAAWLQTRLETGDVDDARQPRSTGLVADYYNRTAISIVRDTGREWFRKASGQ